MTAPLPLDMSADPTPYRYSAPARLDSILFYGVFGLLLFGPLAFGAVEPWSILILQAGTGLLFVVWAVQQGRVREVEIAGSPLFLPMLFFAFVILLQLVSGRTVYRAATFSSALLYCTYGGMSFLVVQVLRKTSQVRMLAWTLSIYGFAIAMFALLQGLSSNGKLYWVMTAQSGGWIYGPYVNHNHYAGLMEMLTPVPLVISFNPGVRREYRVLAGVAAAVMASTIFLSGSRGGMIAFAAEMALLAGWLIKREKTWRPVLVFGAFLLIAAGLAAWVGGSELLDRVATIHGPVQGEISSGTRLQIARDAARMFAQRPVLGWGLGVFQDVYPQFRSFPTDMQVDRAHNDYIQVLAETGGLGFAAVLWLLFSVYRSGFRKLRAGVPDFNTHLTVAALLGITGILVHSFADFNLQIPANAMLFYGFCAVAAMEPRFGLQRRLRHRRHRAADGLQDDLPAAATASIG